MALIQLAATSETVKGYFEKYEYHRGETYWADGKLVITAADILIALSAITKYMSQELSAGYREMVKDRVYASEPEGLSRLSAQTVLFTVLSHLLGMLSPLTPLLVEEVWSHTSESMRGNDIHPLQRPYPILPINHARAAAKLMKNFSTLSRAHDAVKMSMEEARAKKTMKNSLQCSVQLHLQSTEDFRLFQRYEWS